jgi:hypothetical protein
LMIATIIAWRATMRRFGEESENLSAAAERA